MTKSIPDYHERQKALDINQSFIVQAPAGAGKTELLAQRYLKLLSIVDAPENILAMTFTNKAASELQNRIFNYLKDPDNCKTQDSVKLSKSALEKSKSKGWLIEENIERIKVLTFDGLANQIVNLLPNHEQLFAPDILSQEWERENLYKGVAKSVLLSIHDRDYEMSIKEVLRYLDNRSDRFMDLIVAMLKTRDQWIKKLFKQNILSVQAINSGLKKIIDTHLKKIHTISESILNDRFFSLVSQAIDSEFSSLNHMPSAEIADLNQWRLLAKFCLTGEGQWRKSLDKRTGFPTEIKPQKEEIIEMLNSFHEYEHFREVLSEVKLLPNEEINEADIVILSHISEVLKLSLANLKIELSNTNTTDFIELSMMAEEYLGDEESTSEVSLYLDYKIQHILIDEFQDTSTSQFSLLEKLVSQWSDDQMRSLFLVGDPMQSIYRFRESRVELFLHAKMQGIANLKLIPITLETNFRSNRSIVEKNNEIFQQIFPKENDESLGSIAYTPSVSAEIDNGEGFMNFHSFAISDEHAESQSIIKLIEQSLNDKEKKSIGILVRTRKQLRPIVELLEARGINFSGIKTKFLKDHLFTRDLLILARCLLNKSDKLAWLSLLRSPWCGLKLNDLLVISSIPHPNFYNQLSETLAEKLSKDGSSRFLKFLKQIHNILSFENIFHFSELFNSAVDYLNIEKNLNNEELQILRKFQDIIYQCESRDLVNLSTIEKMMEGMFSPSSESNIQLMTIHESKGLEFDHVILPSIESASRVSEKKLILTKEFFSDSLIIAPVKKVSEPNPTGTRLFLEHLEKKQEYFELMRLFYVALTRAKTRLDIFGKFSSTLKANKNSFLSFIEHKFSKDFTEKSFESEKGSENPKLKRLKKITFDNVQKKEEKRDQVFSKIIYDYSNVVGKIYHKFMELEKFDPSKKEIIYRLKESGVDSSLQDSLADNVLELIDRTTSHHDFEWVFRKRHTTKREYSLISENGEMILDRFFKDDETHWIVDFKSDKPLAKEDEDSFANRLKRNHSEQLNKYSIIIKKIYNENCRALIFSPYISYLVEIKH